MAAPLDRSWYNTLVDDTGTGTTGTVWNKTQVDGLLDSVDASLATVVDKTGTPVANQLALFSDADTIKGDPALTWNGANTIETASAPGIILIATGQAVDARRWQIVNAGQLIIRSQTDAGGDIALPLWLERTGRIVLPVGQLTFPTTQNPSADPTTLDDYREGVWTPTFTSSGGQSGQTYAQQVGSYIRVGRLVVVQGHCALTSLGTFGAGAARIAGLPFAPISDAALSIAFLSNISLSMSSVTLMLRSGSTYAEFWYLAGGGASNSAQVPSTAVMAATDVRFSGAYIAQT